MKKRLLISMRCLAVVLAVLCAFSGCGSSLAAANLMLNVEATPGLIRTEPTEDQYAAMTDFAVRLFQQSIKEDSNTLLSPLSVLYALAMTANGAEGETLAQMQDVFGLSVAELNDCLYSYRTNLPEDEKYKLSIANSIWFKDTPDFTVNQDFLQTNADYYNAGIYRAAFDDSTKKDINNWVYEKTDKMIKNILDRIPEEAVMYLVNALAFDAEWQEIYKKNRVRDGVFTKEDGSKQDVELMYSEEHRYLEDENAVGFIKYYKDRKYAFAALLPNEDISVSDYIASLTGEQLRAMLADSINVTVNAAIPKFETAYDTEMSEVLIEMGMPDAFDWTVADFSGIGSCVDGNLVINRVLHKTYISVNEKGTRAGAATVVEMTNESAMDPQEIKTVYLDRPFVYLLIDCEANAPIFIGTMTDVEK